MARWSKLDLLRHTPWTKMANISTVASVVSYQPYRMIDTTVNMFINVGTQKPANGRFD